jgi:CRP/FNR family cyclic AMP-dependent transcriptional regulator
VYHRLEEGSVGSSSIGRVYRDGEIVVRQGGQDDCMHVIQAGEVEVFLERDGHDLPLAVRGEGEVIGEMAIFDHAPHSATVRARGEARILTVDKRGFLRRIQEDPSLAFHILQNMSNRIRDLSEKLARSEERQDRGSEE